MKVITAIGNSIINERLKNYFEYEVIGKDIQYEEGIIEILQQEKNIEMVVLSNILPEEYEFKILINKILKLNKEIKIIVFLKEKNQDLENFLNSKKIYKIFYLDKIDYFFESLKNENSIEKLEDFRREIENKINEDYEKNSIEKRNIYEKKWKNNSFKSIHNTGDNGNVIVITGVSGSGKSITSIILSKIIKEKNKKVLLMGGKEGFSDLNIILDVNEKSESIIKINNFFDLLNIYNKEIKLHNIIKEEKNRYDFIIIDCNLNDEKMVSKKDFEQINNIILLIEPNMLEISKTIKYIESLLNKYYIEKNKIKIIFNKNCKYSISLSVLREIFNEYEILGTINYDEKYNLLINKNIKNVLLKEEYEKIVRCLI